MLIDDTVGTTFHGQEYDFAGYLHRSKITFKTRKRKLHFKLRKYSGRNILIRRYIQGKKENYSLGTEWSGDFTLKKLSLRLCAGADAQAFFVEPEVAG